MQVVKGMVYLLGNYTLRNETYDIFANKSENLTGEHESPTKSHEGGLLSGNGPLHTPLGRFLIQAVIIIAIGKFLHIFLQKLNQPRVISEILGGICLGPSVLGNIPGFTETIFKKESLGFITTLAGVSLVFYMFIVGLELEPEGFFKYMRHSLVIAAAGMVVPFVLGLACSWGLYKYLLVPNVNNVPFLSFLLFIGLAMSITAFPILGRILNERRMTNTRVGLLCLTSAAIDDTCAWVLLALVISVFNAGDKLTALYVFLLALGYAILLLFALRPLFRILVDRFLVRYLNPLNHFLLAAIVMCTYLSSWITEIIGINPIFGAFLFGLTVPRCHNLSRTLIAKIEDIIVTAFLPLFFAISGLKTNIGLLNDGMTWGWLFVVLFLACFGKIFGCTLAAKLIGVNWREASTIGILMNTRALIELIVLNIGYDSKVINGRIFLIFVIMALFTTFIPSPIIAYLYPPKYYENCEPQKQLDVINSSSKNGIIQKQETDFA